MIGVATDGSTTVSEETVKVNSTRVPSREFHAGIASARYEPFGRLNRTVPSAPVLLPVIQLPVVVLKIVTHEFMTTLLPVQFVLVSFSRQTLITVFGCGYASVKPAEDPLQSAVFVLLFAHTTNGSGFALSTVVTISFVKRTYPLFQGGYTSRRYRPPPASSVERPNVPSPFEEVPSICRYHPPDSCFCSETQALATMLPAFVNTPVMFEPRSAIFKVPSE